MEFMNGKNSLIFVGDKKNAKEREIDLMPHERVYGIKGRTWNDNDPDKGCIYCT